MARKGELSTSELDKRWPHQVALPADECIGAVDERIRKFCEDLTIAPREHAYVEDGKYQRVFCFGDAEHAKAFMQAFGGKVVEPKARPRWPGRR